ncbi:MAG TPA: DUF885 domain-containing protein [Flavisolibacter sp.]|nr:DUF885 domain-containing protein [Flavisolibacter sp.]
MRYLLIFLFVVTLGACTNQPMVADATAEGKDDEKLSTLFNQYWEERMRLFPLEATQNGDNRYNDRLSLDISEPFRDTLRAFYTNYLTGIQRFDRTKLSANDQISYDIFKREMEMQLEGLKLNEHLIPFQQFWGTPLTIGQLGSGESSQPFNNAQDYRNWMSRAKTFAVWADTAIANFKKGMVAGYVLPKPLVAKMIPQMQDMANPDTIKNVFFGPLRHMPPAVAGDSALRNEFVTTITTTLLPAYKRLGDFLQSEYLPKARTTTGISSVPNGAARYNYLIRYWTTTDKSADEIYNTGLAEVKRIRGEMERIKTQVGFAGDLNAFFIHLRNDPKLMPFKTAEEVLNAFRSIQQKIEPNLNRMFGRRPKTPFEIRQTEAFRAASASAEYQQGTADGKRPGIFYVPILDATTFNITSGMESLFLHEAIPGHHYQISLQQENESLPKFRRYSWYGAYGEGWALYTESLGKELGLYTDPYQYMGALGDEIHRAIRLVVDVGMHVKGMTREEAIKYMMENEAISEQGATAEIERYMAIPAQALSYKIGALKIRELRDKYTKQLGDKFNLANFHDELLKDGVMPLDIVERKMDAWADRIVAKKA